ncbi:COMM domain-containing protein 10 [Hetaerina americana]|uniref:COMM domain-containing protein 10 n=1 Tax=Hetaerina americana TaxID=62018 RepID=UPI003A7F4325
MGSTYTRRMNTRLGLRQAKCSFYHCLCPAKCYSSSTQLYLPPSDDCRRQVIPVIGLTRVTSLQSSLPLIDSITSPKFPLLLDRIALKLEENAFKSNPFNNEEEERLVISLGVNKEDLTLILESSVYIFEQAAFHMIKPTSLSRQLQSFDLSEKKSDDYANAWGNHAKNIVERLRRSFRNCELQDVSWSLNLQMASKVHAKQKLPLAMLAFHIKDENGPKNACTEFNHEELYNFYKLIDTIQTQLDALR